MPVIMKTIHPFLFALNQNDTNMPRQAEGWMLPGC
jgi:hypothetical protein